MTECRQCAYHVVGPASGYSCCLLRGQMEFAHAMRLENAPCGPQASRFLARGFEQAVAQTFKTEPRRAA